MATHSTADKGEKPPPLPPSSKKLDGLLILALPVFPPNTYPHHTPYLP
jgi:hypothetical protein